MTPVENEGAEGKDDTYMKTAQPSYQQNTTDFVSGKGFQCSALLMGRGWRVTSQPQGLFAVVRKCGRFH